MWSTTIEIISVVCLKRKDKNLIVASKWTTYLFVDTCTVQINRLIACFVTNFNHKLKSGYTINSKDYHVRS